MSHRQDVLINIHPTSDKPQLTFEWTIADLRIKEKHVDEAGKVEKYFTEVYSDENEKKIEVEFCAQLIHDPLPCNYAHAMLIVLIDGEQVKMHAYKKSLGYKGRPKKREKAMKRARKSIRLYIQSFLLQQ